ncbi:hypothetical protein RHMOL_Rhmol10G0163800 [Rhododendron molle]|uniref:Uncharacterized protein n=1 Tax=Rhododendron molle TaxID=49168 RepID=A0ACC0M3G0_RHOML|nr:hypothetical protein RHMOL_Rhmol10G0163800 [Rhododendron molle]
MSKRGKRKDDDDYVSDVDAPAKKTSKKDSDSDDGIVICELSRNRRVSVRIFQGKIVVDIREFYVKDGKQMPGKKGPFLSLFILRVTFFSFFFFPCNYIHYNILRHIACRYCVTLAVLWWRWFGGCTEASLTICNWDLFLVLN